MFPSHEPQRRAGVSPAWAAGFMVPTRGPRAVEIFHEPQSGGPSSTRPAARPNNGARGTRPERFRGGASFWKARRPSRQHLLAPSFFLGLLLATTLAGRPGTGHAAPASAPKEILCAKAAAGAELLAAREVARYAYLRTGSLLPLEPRDRLASKTRPALIVTRRDSALGRFVVDALKLSPPVLGPEQYWLKSISPGGTQFTVVLGGDAVGTLYGAYRLAEHLGVRFYLHGDVVPSGRIPLELSRLEETGQPLFATRGINPFHDFPEGPDWWNRDDYLAYIQQLAKLRMNFIGLHCYPPGGVGPEPAVWIGQAKDLDPRGRVTLSYPSRWANTRLNGPWGYAGMKTGDYCAGAGQLFATDDYGPAVMDGRLPSPTNAVQANRLFNDTADMFRAAFGAARELGVKTCLGTETPLLLPKPVQDQLVAEGKDPKDAAVVREVYRGMFQRIARACPIDYYWLWTPEDWTWSGNKPEAYAATAADMQAALAALKSLGNPFTLATCGWVLGPQQDRAAFDKLLPKNSPIACINREVGHDAIEPGFAKIQGRPTWAIPWMENDPNLTAPQPWVGRMRYDAVDAKRLGCTGLLGIHWRTKIMGPNVAALAAAAWDQSWAPATLPEVAGAPAQPRSGVEGGATANTTEPVTGATEQPVFQTVRYNMGAYRLEIPAGTYNVTLQFSEIHYTNSGQRVFGVNVQGQPFLKSLDIFAQAGKNKALGFTCTNVVVTNGLLDLDFVKITEFPCISGLVIQGQTASANQIAGQPYTRKINCGGGAWQDYEADRQGGGPGRNRGRTMPIDDFYVDFARASFGSAVAEAAGRLLANIDGTNLPAPTAWLGGPGGVAPNPEPWEKICGQYAFVEELAALRPRVAPPADRERLDYWLNTYRYMAAIAEAGCLRGALDKAMAKLKGETNAVGKATLAAGALNLRTQLSRTWERAVTFQIAAVDTPGELGTIDNLERHSRKQSRFLEVHDAELEKVLGQPLPRGVKLSADYVGPARIVVPTVRTLAAPGERLAIQVIILSQAGQASGELRWRPAGKTKFATVPLTRLGRSVFQAHLPMPAGADLVEYQIQARAGGAALTWPAGAPEASQTVVALKP